jgi:nitroreductase
VTFSKPITEIIQQRFSCRSYLEKPIEASKRHKLQDFLASLQVGPLGTPLRFHLIAATEQDRDSLKDLGTYGFIKGASGFIVGAVKPAEKDLEDYGYLMEYIILIATDLDLGTCWLGGSFTRSSFTQKISATDEEQVPAVTSIGYIDNPEEARNGLIRRQVGANNRLLWEELFFHQEFGLPLARQEAGVYATPLEMVRLGPSASNKQPWRIVKDGNLWHFYLQRTKSYPPSFASKLLKIADLQRVDMGIAMCHFELTAKELGLIGKWTIQEPAIKKPDELAEYTLSWTS